MAAILQKANLIRVLIVDDIEYIRRMTRAFFEEKSFIVCGEAVGRLRRYREGAQLKPDLIVLDVSMPLLNGIEAAPPLRKLLPRVNIILFTSHEWLTKGLDADEMGVNAVVSKDRGRSALGDCVHGLLNRAKN